LDGKEYTGERRWDWLRRQSVWKRISPIEYYFTNKKDLSLLNPQIKRIYVLVPGETIIPLVWGIGLHGGELNPFSEKLHYIVPPIFMWVPLLRDILLWTGAVTYHPTKRPVDSVVLDLLQNGRTVCYCPSNFITEENIACPSDAIFKFAREQKFQLVPVVVHGEKQRYNIISYPTVQNFFLKHVHYAFPIVFALRLFTKERPPVLRQQFGSIITCDEKYETHDLLKDSFIEAIKGLTNVELGDDVLKLS
jgi:hypothetical protein